MTASTFDTLAAARELKAAGIEPGPAEAIAVQLRIAAEADCGTLATKADICRALWIQGIGICGVVGGLITLAATLELL